MNLIVVLFEYLYRILFADNPLRLTGRFSKLLNF